MFFIWKYNMQYTKYVPAATAAVAAAAAAAFAGRRRSYVCTLSTAAYAANSERV